MSGPEAARAQAKAKAASSRQRRSAQQPAAENISLPTRLIIIPPE